MARYVNIMSKVSPETAKRLDDICIRSGFRSKYEILQYLISAFLRYADPGGNTEETDDLPVELARIFADYENIATRLIDCQPKGRIKRPKLVAATYYYDKPRSARLLQINGSDIRSTGNNREIIELVVSRLLPALYSKAVAVKRQRHLPTIVAAIEEIVRETTVLDSTDEAVQLEFNQLADAEAPTYGVKPPNAIHYEDVH